MLCLKECITGNYFITLSDYLLKLPLIMLLNALISKQFKCKNKMLKLKVFFFSSFCLAFHSVIMITMERLWLLQKNNMTVSMSQYISNA